MMDQSLQFDGFRKRSGDIVPFSREKIESAILNAGKAVERKGGESSISLSEANRLTEIIIEQLNTPSSEYYVRAQADTSRIPHIEDVQDLVEIALSEEGHSSVVSAYKRYRKQREVARRQIRVRSNLEKSEVDVTDASLLLVESTSGNITKPWDRTEIVRQIVEETDLSVEAAISVAKEVENMVLRGSFRLLNTALIRELVNNVLIDRGYTAQLQDLSIYRIPKKFVEQLMYTKGTENSNIVNNNPEAVNLGLSELVLKQWGLETIFSPEVKRAHDTGAIHLHDLGYPHRVYCSSHSIEYIKKYGLTGLSNLNTESKPARTASVLTGHLNTFLASMQANYAGALGIAYINILYAPYLEGMDYPQIKQIAQELIFNGAQNAFSRGGQTLFLDFNIHTGVPGYMQDVPAIGPRGKYMILVEGEKLPLEEILRKDLDHAGNKLMDLFYTDAKGIRHLVLSELADADKGIIYDKTVEAALQEKNWKIVTYGDFTKEARDFAGALLNVWGEGDKNGRIFEFPKCDFHVSDETFNDPAQYAIYMQACELASRNGSTYFIFDRDEVTLSACCRLRTTIQDNRMLRHPESMRFCGFQNVTVNIPQAAYRAARKGEKSLEGLFQELDTTMDLAVEAHLQKKARIQVMMSEPGRPLYQLGKEACDGRPYVELEKATYILGLIGVNDAVNFLYGMELHENDEAMNIGLRIVAHMFLKAKKLAAKHNLKFSLEESPAESAARRLAKTDLIYYGKEAGSIVKGEDEDSVYYTNSIHMTADAPISLVERIRLQSKFHSMIESGAITHAFVGEAQPSAESIAALMKEILFRTQSAQVTISPEFTFCEDCNHNFRGLVETCERCGSANVFGETRVVGYFSRIQNWNKSKRYGELVARQRGNYAVETAEQSEEIVQFA
ncbi:MAG: anaerobic ribonucleoside-triphosphate reductase [Spirochaetes bacterium]|nr:anaerobic ribonucleoside-triphosphate reductase [Spirochaetota bacterium]